MRVGYYFAFDYETPEAVTVPGQAGRAEIDFLMFRGGKADHVSGWSHGRNGSTPVSYSLGMPELPVAAAIADLLPTLDARARAELLVRALEAVLHGITRKDAVKEAKSTLECADHDYDRDVLAALDVIEKELP